MMIFRSSVKAENRGMTIPLVIAIIVFLALLAFGLYRYTSFEKNLVARIQHASVSEKLAQAAVNEAANLLNYKVINFKNLDAKNDLDRFILAPVSEHNIDDMSFYMTGSNLRSFDLAARLGGKLEYVEMKYERFRKYFNDPATPENYAKSCFIPSDPFERYGGVIISAKVSFKSSVRIFCCRYEIKTSQTLAPVLSKFTFFMKGSDKGDQNELHMSAPTPEEPDIAAAGNPFESGIPAPANVANGNGGIPDANNPMLADESFGSGEWQQNYQRLAMLKKTTTYLQGNRGLLDIETKYKRVPIVFIHHPDDMALVSGFGKTHAEIREYLPMDLSVSPKGVGNNISYRPSITNRGWVYMGSDDPRQIYFHNISPGKINPPIGAKPEPDNDFRFFGNAFMIKEYGIPLSAKMCRDYKIPYPYAFTDFSPAGKLDYILRVTQTGIYWIYKDTAMENVLGNFYKKHPDMPADSSLLQISGDMQVKSYSGDQPASYLDRRSPTLVLGKVFRFYMQVGQISQNCVHPPSSKFFKEMQPNGLHDFPYLSSDHVHPQSRWLPYFDMGKDGKAIDNPAVDITDNDWNGLATIDDRVQSDFKTPVPPDADFEKKKYNINHDVFKCYDNQHNQVYKFFMTKPVCEVFNRSYDNIVANAGPAGGVFKPSDKYSMSQDNVKILSAYPDAQLDSQFFYGDENNYGNCVYGSKLKISQYSSKNLNDFETDDSIYSDGLFKGALQAVQLTCDNYKNPMKNEAQVAVDRYDLRYKADYIFDSLADFESLFTKKGEGGSMEIKNGGVFYIDSDQPIDLTKGKSVPRIIFHDNAMLIFKNDVKIPDIIKSSYARETGSTLTIISAHGNITIAGEEIEASLNSLSGTIKKDVEYFQVFGNLTMARLNFEYAKDGNLFKSSGIPKGAAHRVIGSDGLTGYKRLAVVYDPALDPCDVENYKKHYNYTLSSRQTFWRATTE